MFLLFFWSCLFDVLQSVRIRSQSFDRDFTFRSEIDLGCVNQIAFTLVLLFIKGELDITEFIVSGPRCRSRYFPPQDGAVGNEPDKDFSIFQFEHPGNVEGPSEGSCVGHISHCPLPHGLKRASDPPSTSVS